jgi:hypothetical protein
MSDMQGTSLGVSHRATVKAMQSLTSYLAEARTVYRVHLSHHNTVLGIRQCAQACAPPQNRCMQPCMHLYIHPGKHAHHAAIACRDSGWPPHLH